MSIASYLSQLLNSSGLVPVAKINATGTPSATNYLRGDGSWQTITAPQVYSAAFGTSTTWTAPTGCTSVKVWCIGGGGGGGLNSACAATPQNGGAGGVSIGVYTVTPGTVYTVTVGAGGDGTSTNATNGSSGGTSYFGPSGSPVISATGGAGGSNNSTTYSAQGVGSSGTIYNSTSLLILPSNIAFAPHGSSPLGTSISCGYPTKFGASGDQVAKTWSSGVYSPGVGGGGSGGAFSGGGVNGIIWLDWVA